MTRCKYSLCATPRPLNALEQPMGWHIPCLNIKHADESSKGWQRTPTEMQEKKRARDRRYYEPKRTQRQEAG